MLRAQGVAARARCGFGAYFEKGKFVDHWVTEYWNEAQKRWVLVDAQLDARQRELFKVTFDPLDVPRDQFLVAGDAWRLCRAARPIPMQFGILDMHGLWFVAGNLIRDVAALNNHEMLPWDVWGAMARSDAELDLRLLRSPGRTLARPRRACRRAARRLRRQARRRSRHGVQRRAQPSRPPFIERSRPCKRTPPSPARNG